MKIKVCWLLVFTFWTGLIIFLAFQERQTGLEFVYQLAEAEARGNFNKDLLYRRWAAKQGGLYVRESDYTPPNPHLQHLPDRDLATTTGDKLTLVNPAYMTRQVHELSVEQYGVKGHITSLKPLRPENAPDDWERKALVLFEQGQSEVSEQALIGETRYLRMMFAMPTEEFCLKCHAHQGYQVGDVRGGISVSIPMKPYFDAYYSNNQTLLGHKVILWLVGCLLLLSSLLALRTHLKREYKTRLLLESSEQKYRNLFNNATVGFALAEAQSGRILECNEALAQMVERSVAELIGQPQKILHPDEPGNKGRTEVFVRHSRDIIGTVHPATLLTRSGREVPVEIKAQAIQRDGRDLVFGIFQDISERTEATRKQQELEGLLRQKYKMEAVGIMAGGIAHDFNNILAVVITNLELMKRKAGVDNPLLPRIEQARSAALRGSELVRQILTYSRQGEPNLKPIKLTENIEETLKMLRSTIPASIEVLKNVDVKVKNAVVAADPIQIEEVLVNLCTNAVHAMGEKGLLTVTLRLDFLQPGQLPLQPESLVGDCFRLDVSDTGSGMSPELLEKIFDPFYTTKPEGTGTGMGLSISHGIISRHNGCLTVKSTPGAGSTFSAYLPITNGATEEFSEEQWEKAVGGGEHILFVDDEETLARSISEYFSDYGYSVTYEIDSQKAVDLVQRQPQRFDLIVTDQTMPVKTGLELVEDVLAFRPDLPIVLCTGYSATVTEEKALEAGARAFLLKPVSLPQLVKTVRLILDGEL